MPEEHQDSITKGLGKVTTYRASHGGHDIELAFDRRAVLLNAALLSVDGERVDKARIFYGEKELRTTLPDGTEIVVAVDSGMGGELTRTQLRTADGGWLDLQERAA